MKFMTKSEQSFEPKASPKNMPAIQRPASQAKEMSESVVKHIEAWDILVKENDTLRQAFTEKAAENAALNMKVNMLLEEIVNIKRERDYYYQYANEMSVTFLNIIDPLSKCMQKAKLATYGDEKKEPHTDDQSGRDISTEPSHPNSRAGDQKRD